MGENIENLLDPVSKSSRSWSLWLTSA